jgi:hypothetical protein
MIVRAAPGRDLFAKIDDVVVSVLRGDLTTLDADLIQAEQITLAAGAPGWIASDTDQASVRPYMAHYGALGLLAAYQRHPAAPIAHSWLSIAIAWATWYGDHLDVNGYVHDWTIDGAGALTDLGDDSMDSTDAYAGMWLLLLARIAAITGNTDHIDWAEVNLCLDGVESTQQPDGLTWAKPSYTAKYLEDNIECLVGLRALQAVDDDGDGAAARAADIGGRMAHGISNMWVEETTSWDWAIDGSGGRTKALWTSAGIGESSLRQHVWSIAYHAVPDDEVVRQYIIDRYVTEYPDWASGAGSYEIMTAIALNYSGETVDATVGAASLYAAGEVLNWDWPWGTISAGQWLLYSAAPDWGFPSLGLDVDMRAKPNLLTAAVSVDTDSNANGLWDGWGTYFPGTVTPTVVSGVQRLVADSAAVISASNVAVDAHEWYTFSVYMDTVDVGQTVLKIEWYNDAAALVDYTYEINPDVTDGEERRWITRLSPAGSSRATAVVGIDSGGGNLTLRAPRMEQSGGPTTPS